MFIVCYYKGTMDKNIFYYRIWLPEVHVTHSSSIAKPIIRSKFPVDWYAPKGTTPQKQMQNC